VADIRIPPPPLSTKDSGVWATWYIRVKDAINQLRDSLAWTSISFIGSNLTDILTRNHNDLQNIQGGGTTERYHLTLAQHTDLTDGGETTLHSHALDADLTAIGALAGTSGFLKKTAANTWALETGYRVDSSLFVVGTSAATAGRSLTINRNPTGATGTYGCINSGTIQSDVTTAHFVFATNPSTAAASFTLNAINHFQASQGTIGATSTVTYQHGFRATTTLVGATYNYGFLSEIPADGTNDWNFYSVGTAPNHFKGATTFGTSFGYGTDSGVGSTVTQATSKATGVTIDKICGQITTHNASLGSGDSVAFRVTNSTVAATDVIMLSLASGGTAAAYDYGIDKVGSGYFDIYLFNYNGGGALAEALVINFVVIKSVAS
jgi:hypothetical protein